MVLAVIDGVDTHCINAELLEPSRSQLVSHGEYEMRRTYSVMSRVQVAWSAIGSAASEDPPG